MYRIITFYKFVPLPNYREIQKPLLEFCESQGLRGSILLAEEGINSTIAGSHAGIEALLAHLRADERLTDLTYKESHADELPFERMKVRLKKEIVTMKQTDVDPTRQVGTYIEASDWNTLIEQPNVMLIDTRNDYEIEIGTFQGAINPEIEHFSQFPEYVQQLKSKNIKKVALFCTGGIRCEKATSYMLAEGFEEVYHLNGGILKYLENVKPEDSLWDGECFVFDERISVDHQLQAGKAGICEKCQRVLKDRSVPCPGCQHFNEKISQET